jgi:hypothetical protein
MEIYMKNYSTPLVTASDVVRTTESGLVTKIANERNTMTITPS